MRPITTLHALLSSIKTIRRTCAAASRASLDPLLPKPIYSLYSIVLGWPLNALHYEESANVPVCI